MNNPNTTCYVGLDVHKDTIAIAVAEPGEATGTSSRPYPTISQLL